MEIQTKENVIIIVDKLGISKKLKGYTYIVDVLSFMLKEDPIDMNFSEMLSKSISNYSSFKETNKSINYAIDVAFEKDLNVFRYKFFKNYVGEKGLKVTVLEFIYEVFYYLKYKDELIYKIFRDIGLKANHQGYRYLIEMYNCLNENFSYDISLQKDIYPYMFERFNITYEKMFYCSRNALINLFEKDLTLFSILDLSLNKKNRSVKHFLFVVYNYIKYKDIESIEKTRYEELRNIGVPAHVKGMKYLLEILEILDKYPKIPIEELCDEVAYINQVTKCSVKRDLFEVVKYIKNDKNNLKYDVFYDTENLTTKEMIRGLYYYFFYENRKDDEQLAYNILITLGLPFSFKGYSVVLYILDSIKKKEDIDKFINPSLYIRLSKMNNCTENDIENWIKNIIRYVFSLKDNNLRKQIYGESEHETNMSFLKKLVCYKFEY